MEQAVMGMSEAVVAEQALVTADMIVADGLRLTV